MAGAKSGFLGGLLEGVGTALFDAKQQKLQQEEQSNRTLASIMLHALDADPTRETATAVLPKVAELMHGPVTTLFGLKLGKGGKGGKGGPDLGALFGGLAESFPTRDEFAKQGVARKEAEAAAGERGRITEQIAGKRAEFDEFNKRWASDDEFRGLFEREGDTEGSAKRRAAEASGLFSREPGASSRALQIVGRDVDLKSVPPDARDLEGKPTERLEGVTYNQIRLGTTPDGKPDMRYEPGKATKPTKPTTGTDILKGIAGPAREAVDEALMKRKILPTEATQEQIQSAVPDAYALLHQKRQLDEANRGALLAIRNWTLGPGLAGVGASATGAGVASPEASAQTPQAKAEGVLKGLSATDATEVKEIAEYRRPIQARYAQTPRGSKMMALADQWRQAQGLPKFDVTQYASKQATRTAFEKGKEAQDIRSLAQLTGHMAQAARAAVALGNSETQLWNLITNKGIEQVGDPRVTAFMIPSRAVINEITRITRGGVGNKEDIEAFQKQLSVVNSPRQLITAIDAFRQLAKSRMDQLRQQWRVAMGDEPFTFLSPEAEKVYGDASTAGVSVGQFKVRVK